MDRMACVDIRALPLQLMLRRHRDWETHPVVVVDRDKPIGMILWANDHARAQRIFPGMRYAAGLALSRELRGGVVPETDIHAAVALVTKRLWSFSPRIEPSPHDHGIFWLDASGLRYVYPSLETWATSIRDDLRDAGFRAAVGVGFTRFGSYAAARSNTENIVFHDPERERVHLRNVAIERLGFDPALRDTLFKLGIETLGGFIDLPAAGIRRRFGADAEALHSLARGDGWTPLNPQRLFEPIECREPLEYPEDNVDRLLALFASVLQSLLAELAARHETLKALCFALLLGDGTEHREEVAPATPTLDANQILQLLRLRMETISLPAPVMELNVRAIGIAVSHQQPVLFHDAPHQDIESAEAAFAKIRAQFGNDAVARAHLHEGHLPEACYGWEPLAKLALPRPSPTPTRPLVRRIYTPPIELPPRDRHEPDGWMIAGIADGPVEEVIGPQIISGGWWMTEVSRAYYYVRTRTGRWLWIYHDHQRRRWFLQGEVQ